MSIPVTCDECFTDFKVKDQHAGKRFRCKNCDAIVTVPRARPVPEDDWDDDFESDALPPVVKKPSRQRAKSRQRSATGTGLQGFYDRLSPGRMIGAPMAAMFVSICLALVLPSVAKFLFWLLYLFAGGITITGMALSVVTAFKEDSSCGLMFLFVPFYSIYYIFDRWPTMWKPTTMILVGLMIFLFPIILALAAIVLVILLSMVG